MAGFDEQEIKKIVQEEWGPFGEFSDEVIIFPSPDGKFAAVFSHGAEIAMMDFRYVVTVLGAGLETLCKFGQVPATRPACEWCTDSSRFAFPAFLEGECYVVYVAPSAKFALLRVSSRQSLCQFEGTSILRIRFDPEQLTAMNSDTVFPGNAKADYPIQRFVAPQDAVIDLSSLEWYGREETENVEPLLAKAVVYNMSAEKQGYFPYHGKFPQSTTESINGRQLEVFHLEAFAAYGDRQAQVWLMEIRKMAGKDYDRWAQVSQYLGDKKRTIPPPPEG